MSENEKAMTAPYRRRAAVTALRVAFEEARIRFQMTPARQISRGDVVRIAREFAIWEETSTEDPEAWRLRLVTPILIESKRIDKSLFSEIERVVTPDQPIARAIASQWEALGIEGRRVYIQQRIGGEASLQHGARAEYVEAVYALKGDLIVEHHVKSGVSEREIVGIRELTGQDLVEMQLGPELGSDNRSGSIIAWYHWSDQLVLRRAL